MMGSNQERDDLQHSLRCPVMWKLARCATARHLIQCKSPVMGRLAMDGSHAMSTISCLAVACKFYHALWHRPCTKSGMLHFAAHNSTHALETKGPRLMLAPADATATGCPHTSHVPRLPPWPGAPGSAAH